VPEGESGAFYLELSARANIMSRNYRPVHGRSLSYRIFSREPCYLQGWFHLGRVARRLVAKINGAILLTRLAPHLGPARRQTKITKPSKFAGSVSDDGSLDRSILYPPSSGFYPRLARRLRVNPSRGKARTRPRAAGPAVPAVFRNVY
jgi:hypothetical protein